MKAPNWCKDAIPTPKGWVSPKTGEIYKVVRFTEEQLAEWNKVDVEIPSDEDIFDQIVPEAPLAPPIDLQGMTKAQLVAYADEIGITVAKKANKATLIATIEAGL